MKELQSEIHAWHLRNYPSDDEESALLGIGEELGELMRAELKQSGGIRGSWDEWEAEKKKEAGDVLIGLLNFCEFVGASVQAPSDEFLDLYYEPTGKKLSIKMCLLSVNLCFTKLIQIHADMTYIPRLSWVATFAPRVGQYDTEPQYAESFSRTANDMMLEMAYYCRRCGFSLPEVLASRWATISKRDFIANPATGGRENEDKS